MAGLISRPSTPARADKREELVRSVLPAASRPEQRSARAAEKSLWSASTEEVLAAIPMRLMISDGNRVVRHLNPTAKAEMDALMGTLGLTGTDLLGLPIDVLSATPGYVAADAESGEGPSTFRVDNGQDVVEVTVSAIEHGGRVVGSIAAWSSVSDKVNTERILGAVAAENGAVDSLLRSLDSAATSADVAVAAITGICTNLGWEYGCYWEVDPATGALVLATDAGAASSRFREGIRTTPLTSDLCLAGRARAQREVIVVEPLEGDTGALGHESLLAEGFVSGLAMPVVVGIEVVGVIGVFARTEQVVMSSRRASLGNLAQIASHAIARLRSEAAVAETMRDTGAVAELLAALVTARDPEEAALIALATVRSVFDWDYGSFWFVDESAGELRFLLDSGSVGEDFARASRDARYLPGQGISGRAWASRDLVVVDDLGLLTDCVRADAARRSDVRTALCLPITVDGAVVGTMDFVCRQTLTLSSARVETMRSIGRLLSQTLERLQIEERERAAAQGLQESVDQILRIIGAAAHGDLRQDFDEVPTDNESVADMVRGPQHFFGILRGSFDTLAQTSNALGAAGNELGSVSSRMMADASATADQVDHLTSSVTDVARNIEGVSTAADELKASIAEIAMSATGAAVVARDAVVVAGSASDTMEQLSASSAEIGKVIKTITDIAAQTNMLALNATIEAARAGAAGKGFAVVANEVKELAKGTALATQEISRRVQAIQEGTAAANAAIGEITGVIGEINAHQAAISTAVEQQSATTSSMAYNVSAASDSAQAIKASIRAVGTAADSTRSCSEDSQRAAQELAEMSSEMQRQIGRYRY